MSNGLIQENNVICFKKAYSDLVEWEKGKIAWGFLPAELGRGK